PRRAARRRAPRSRGELDRRRMLREELRRAGEPGPVRRHHRTVRARRVVLLVDVSGSMAPYADALLHLAHAWVRAAPGTTEVFTVGTRLTRVTRAMRVRDGHDAVRAAAAEVPDWSGGTRLGEVLGAFLDRWGQRGTARGAVVVVFSDGWERGDPAYLGEQAGRLRRLAHRVLWANPHRGRAGYLPLQGGIAAVLPHLDGLVAGHSVASFAALADAVAEA
ncbi:MAG: VWA domain-containing protein, partial [Kineosporiaceae bacterium]